MGRTHKAVAFSVAQTDIPRLDRLTDSYGGGNRSEFLRVAMDKLEASQRAEQLRRLQAYGRERSAQRGVTLDEVRDIVHRARDKKSRLTR